MKFLLFTSIFLILSCSQQSEEGSTSVLCEVNKDENDQSYLSRFQFGDTWGRTSIEDLQPTNHLDLASRSYVAFLSSSGFYLGKHHGTHLVATANHSFQSEQCQVSFSMPVIGYNNKTDSCIFSDPSVDIKIFGFEENDPSLLLELKTSIATFDFSYDIHKNSPLYLISRHLFNTPISERFTKEPEYVEDSDCRILSNTSELLIHDGANKFVFSIGCDATYGDSGSAVRDKSTHKVIGLISGGSDPVPKQFQCSSTIESFISQNYNNVWKAALAIPASSIRNAILEFVNSSHANKKQRDVLLHLISS